METALVLFTRDLRIRDQPALAAALAAAKRIVPAFIFDEALLAGSFAAPNRMQFLLDCLADLDGSLRQRGGALVYRRGDFVREAMQLASVARCGAIFLSADVSAFAQQRRQRLGDACRAQGIALQSLPGITVVPPAQLQPSGGDHFKVFSPYFHRWRATPLRAIAPTPKQIALAEGIDPGAPPTLAELVDGAPSPELARGGETRGRLRLAEWARRGLAGYEDGHDDLAGDLTSRISPYLHFGCLSPVEMVHRLRDRNGAEPFLRQLCWRDFYHQVTAAFPRINRSDYRPRGDHWSDQRAHFDAWRAGRTGYPIVDAGMRQLQREGWMHNRARLITASFLVKDLYLDWRWGARHFMHLLVDGDVANNYGNWQWVAGTGNDTRPNRVFNPSRQAECFDPDGEYVRRYVPELGAVAGKAVHEPWDLLTARAYPRPIVDHRQAALAFQARRRS